MNVETVLQISTPAELEQAVVESERLTVRGGGTKSNLSAAVEGAAQLDLSALTGILEYDPGEYTFTARAATPLKEVVAALAEHGQYLPFDPPLVAAGATLGGTVAAGLSGSERHRYGGVRDFLLGAHFVDGRGRLVRGGGKVVKNAAGFDLPKLMVGSLGRLGILTEVTFKVFPQPQSYCTLRRAYSSLQPALQSLAELNVQPLEIDALDLQVGDNGQTFELLLRVGGLPGVLTDRLARLTKVLGGGDVLVEDEEAALWAANREFAWRPEGAFLAKVPTVIDNIEGLEHDLTELGALRRYIAGGNQAWIASAGDPQDLDEILQAHRLGGLTIMGAGAPVQIGVWPGRLFLQAIKQTLDPEDRFLAFD